MLDIEQKDNWLTINLKVHPKSSANKVVGEHNGALKVSVTAPPEGGKANAAVVKLLSKLLRIPKSNVEIVSGQTSKNKRIRILGIKPVDIGKLIKG